MCFGGGGPQQPQPYAPPSSGPPGTSLTPVPHWMVREVLEQRHSRRTPTSRRRARVTTPDSPMGTGEDSLLVGKVVLGGDT